MARYNRRYIDPTPTTGISPDAIVDPVQRITLKDWEDVQDQLYLAERRGVCIDVDLCEAKLAEAQKCLEGYKDTWATQFPGVNPSSFDQVAVLFYAGARQQLEAELDHKVTLAELEVKHAENDLRIAVESGAKYGRETNKLATREKRLIKAKQEREEFNNYPSLDLPVSPITKKGPTKPGKFPTDSAALEWLEATQGINLHTLVLIRQTKKTVERLSEILSLVRSTDGQLTWRLHGNFKRGCKTGRLSCASPNLQNIPADPRKDRFSTRSIFVASPGHKLIVVDYAQLEMRTLAHILVLLYGDTRLKDDLLAEDAHSVNALRVFGPLRPYLDGVTADQVKDHPDKRVKQCRSDVKAVAYGFVYGKTAIGLGATLRYEDGNPIGEAEATKVMDGFLNLYPALADYSQFIWDAVRHGKVYSIGGRCKQIEYLSEAEHRAALNYPNQSSSEDIIDRALLNCVRELSAKRLDAMCILAVHDELVFEVPIDQAEAAAEVIKNEMKNAWQMLCPLDVTVCIVDNWGQAK